MKTSRYGQAERTGPRVRADLRQTIDSPAAAGLISLAWTVCFVVVRLAVAADWNITKFVRAALPFSHPGRVPSGLFVFGSNGYDGQFYYRLALDPANLHRTAFGITMDAAFRLQRIGYPVLGWLFSLGQHRLVPVALVVVNLLAIGAIGTIGAMLAVESGRHAIWGLLLAGYFGFFISVGCDLTEPVAAACLLGGVLAYRRQRPVVAGLLFGYGALTRETVIIVPLAIVLARLVAAVRGSINADAPVRGGMRAGITVRGGVKPSTADLAWLLPVLMFTVWQLVLRVATGTLVAMTGFGDNTNSGLPFARFLDALRANIGLLWPPTGAAYIWFAEVATLVAFVVAALIAVRSAAVAGYEKVAFIAFIIELGILSNDIWTGHADLRSIDECYLFAILILLGSRWRRLPVLAACAAVTAVIAAVHQTPHV